MPLSWITLYGVGDLSLKPMHLAIFPLFFCLLSKTFRRSLLDFIKKYQWLIVFFFLLMVVNYIATALSPVKNANSWSYIIKNCVYFFCFLLFGGMSIIFIGSKNFCRHITISNTVCIIVFIIVASFTFQLTGGNFLGDLVKFFFAGDVSSLKYALYKTLFNASGVSGDSDVATNLLNTLIGAFIFIHFTSLYAFNNLKKTIFRVLNIFNILFSVFFVISSVSRSNIIAVIFGYLIFWFSDIVFNGNKKRILRIIFIFILGVTFVLVFWTKIEDMFSGASTMIAGRFSELDQNARWALDAEALTTFLGDFQTFFIGKGSGAVLSDGHSVHNFILGGAYQAGIMGLIISIAFYFGLMYSVIKYAKILTKGKSAFIMSALMAIPLIRAMEAGGAGSLTLQEWFCTAFFFAFIIKVQNDEVIYK